MQSQLSLPVAKVKCKYRSLLSKDPRQLANLQLANLLDKFCPGSQEIIFKDELEDFFQYFAELTKWQFFLCSFALQG